MSKSQRNLVLQWGLLISWSVIGPIALSRAADAPKPKAADDPAKAQLEKAVDAVAAAAKDSVANAANDQQAIRRAQLSLDILRNIGELGGFDTNPQIDKLIDEFRATAQPSVVEAVIVQKFNNKVRTWFQMNDTERAAVLDPFVSEIKKNGLTHDYAEALVRLASNWGDRDQSKMLAKAISNVLPSAKDPTDPKMKRVLALLEGIGRRLDLPGKPLELEGKLLDGSTLDWKSYKGKVVLVDFYASWCGPCRAEAPNVLKNYKAYHDKGFEVVTVNLDADPKLAEKYIKETGCDFPTIFSADPKVWDTPMAVKYGVTAIPRVILVGKDGNVVSTNARGPLLGQLLNKLLGPPSEGAAEAGGDENKTSGDKPATKADVVKQ